MVAKELRTFIVAKNVVTTKIYYGLLPDTPNNSISIVDSPAVVSGHVKSHGIQIISRNISLDAGWSDLSEIHKILHEKGIKDIVLSSYTVSWCTASSEIIHYNTDSKGRYYLSLNFNISMKSYH